MNQEQASTLGGTILRVPPHRPMLLDDASMSWVVLDGSARLLVSGVDQATPVGPRHELARALKHELLWSIDPDTERKHGLFLLSTSEVSLLAIPSHRLPNACTALGISIPEAVDAWAQKLSSFIALGSTTPNAEPLPSTGTMEIEKDLVMRGPFDQVCWTRVQRGEISFLDRCELSITADEAFLPVGSELWFRASEPASLTIKSVHDCVETESMTRGLALLHSLLVSHVDKLDTAAAQAERTRLDRRETTQRRRAEAAFQKLASVLHPQEIIEPSANTLLGAAALVGQALGVKIQPPSKSENPQRTAHPLEAIARASRIQHRQVLLRGSWWKRDCGPLIGFLAENYRPVALLRSTRGRYEIIDPQTGSRTRVGHSTAPSLSPKAAMLYRPLTKSVKRPFDLIKFLIRGKLLDVGFVLALAVLASLLGMLTPLATALVMDTAIPGADAALLWQLGLGLVAAAMGAAMLDLSQGYVGVRMGISTDATAQSALWARLLNLRVSFFHAFSSGDLLSRLDGVSEVNQTLNGATVRSLLLAFSATLNLLLLFYFSVQLASIAVILGVIVVVVTTGGGLIIRQKAARLMELRGHFFGLVVQMVNAVGKIRVAGAQQRAFTTWVNGYAAQLNLIRDAQAVGDCLHVFNQAIPTVALVMLFWIGADLLSSGGSSGGLSGLSIGIFLAFYAAMGTFLRGVTSLSNTAIDLMEASAAAKRIEVVLSGPQEVDESKVDPGRLRGAVSLTRIEFRYTEAGRKILDDLSLHADPTEFIALVGPSGSGKSTIFRLLLGFESPQCGTVSYDGRDLDSVDIVAVRRQLGVVLQGGRISCGSILENMSAGCHISLDEAWNAAEDAGFADDLRNMPMGLHTMVSEGGTNFSGGQRQRLLIARALVTRPKILLMDEATSALDNRTQEIVSASLERRKVTRIVIAHRLSTIQHADRIYVLEHGKVVQTGRYLDLIRQEGLFASMMARQKA